MFTVAQFCECGASPSQLELASPDSRVLSKQALNALTIMVKLFKEDPCVTASLKSILRIWRPKIGLKAYRVGASR